MNTLPLVLLITRNSSHVERLHGVLANHGCQLRQAFDMPMASARLAGGGVAAVLLDWSGLGTDEEHQVDIETLRRMSPRLPVLVLGGSEELRLKAVQSGASGFVTMNDPADAGGAIRDAISKVAYFPPEVTADSSPRRRAPIITILGAKGGVGTSTIAWNLVTLLAQGSTVVLAEMRSTPGSMAYFFRPGHVARGLVRLLEENPAALGVRTVETCLWPSPSSPGLHVLFGPQSWHDCRDIDSAAATAILHSLAAFADYVVVELPPSLSSAHRAVLENSDYLALAVEREGACVDAAKLMLETIVEWDSIPSMSGIAVLNRAAIGLPVSLEEMETQLGLPILTSIPPAPDLCFHSQRIRMPLVELDPQSLAAASMVTLAEGVRSRRAVQRKLA